MRAATWREVPEGISIIVMQAGAGSIVGRVVGVSVLPQTCGSRRQNCSFDAYRDVYNLPDGVDWTASRAAGTGHRAVLALRTQAVWPVRRPRYRSWWDRSDGRAVRRTGYSTRIHVRCH